MNQDDCEGFSLKLFFSKILSLGGACKKQSVSLFVLNMVVSYSYFSKCLIPGLGARNETLLENMNKTLRKETNYTFYLMLIPQIRLLNINQTLANRLKYGHQIKKDTSLELIKTRRRPLGFNL